jgi:hypothetical protein
VGPKITNTGILLFAAASLGFVLGFAYGNVLGLERVFDLEKWQTLVGTVVAVLAAAAAFLGVRGTQRINVILKEQERLDILSRTRLSLRWERISVSHSIATAASPTAANDVGSWTVHDHREACLCL